MSEELLVRFCSPTLAGLKTGSMVTCPFATREELGCELRRLNRAFIPKGLRILPLRYRGGRALLYLYRPEMLRRDLADPAAAQLLECRGYAWRSPARSIAHLIERLKTQDEFPHEVGLFLGYPPVDVRGFIEHRADCCKCVGTWKVYGDEARCRALFDQYKKCTACLCEHWESGVPVEQLAVAG